MTPLATVVILCLIFAFSGHTFAAKESAGKTRTISDISSIPHQVLQRGISPKFYKTLLVSPIEGYVIVRGQLGTGTRLSGLRVVHSELGGAYDSLALERAKDVSISGYYTTDKMSQTGNVILTLLIYKIADGTAALSFVQVDEPGGDQAQYYGCAVLAVLKSDGKWTEIKSVDSLHGKGMVLRNTRSGKFALREIYFFGGFRP
jgi:hypothetical protein